MSVFVTVWSRYVCVCDRLVSVCLCLWPSDLGISVFVTVWSRYVCVCDRLISVCLCLWPSDLGISVFVTVWSRYVCVCDRLISVYLCLWPSDLGMSVFVTVWSRYVCVCHYLISICMFLWPSADVNAWLYLWLWLSVSDRSVRLYDSFENSGEFSIMTQLCAPWEETSLLQTSDCWLRCPEACQLSFFHFTPFSRTDRAVLIHHRLSVLSLAFRDTSYQLTREKLLYDSFTSVVGRDSRRRHYAVVELFLIHLKWHIWQ